MFAISLQSVIPMRKEASHRSEMVSQMIFFERCEILSEQDQFVFVRNERDGYEGWVQTNQLTRLSHENRMPANTCIVTEPITTITIQDQKHYLPFGTCLPARDFEFLHKHFSCKDVLSLPLAVDQSLKLLRSVFLHVTYLWGGKTIHGIDCSGLTQIFGKCIGKEWPRDSSQQALLGQTIYFVEEAVPGDLAFFGNDEPYITHVGIILDNNKILHASGKVRIDPLDNIGIWNGDIAEYSHQLKLIKRMDVV